MDTLRDITDIPKPKLSPIFESKGHKGSNTGTKRGWMAWATLGQAGGTCCKGGSGPGLVRESLGGRMSWAESPGCWEGAGEGDRKL